MFYVISLLLLTLLVHRKRGQQIQIGSCVTDGGSDMKKARRLLVEKYPWLIVGHCATHVMDLLLEDLYDLDYVKQTLDKMNKVVSFVKNHSVIKYTYFKISGYHIFERGETRFGTHVTSMVRLLKTKNSLKKTLEKSEDFFSHAKKTVKESFTLSKKLVDSNAFWEELIRVKFLRTQELKNSRTPQELYSKHFFASCH